MRHSLRSVGQGLLVLVFAVTVSLGAEGEEDRSDLADEFRRVATLEVPVAEISGMAPLPGGDASRRSFLVVTDEGGYDVETRVVRGALFHLAFEHADGKAPAATAPSPVTLHVELERFDPGWPARVSPLDLESIVRLPGAENLFLLGGERNPEDQTDDGANRLYVVRYPDGAPDRARVVAYFRLFDLPDDLMNDRFEGCAARAAAPVLDGETAWTIFAFKERTAFPERAPAYVRGRLSRGADGTFALKVHGDRGYPPLLPDFVTRDHRRVSSQADACLAEDGSVWILDRWRRQIHVADVQVEDGRLRLRRSLDYLALVKDIPGETSAIEPAPPGLPGHPGYGRHEALTFDADGRLYLATDRGGDRSSTVTVLVKRAPETAPAEPGSK